MGAAQTISTDLLTTSAVIRNCVEAKENGRHEIVLWGDGSPTREFLYVEDAAEGILLATERYNGDQPVNLGTSQEIGIRDLTQMIVRKIGFTGERIWDTTKPNGQPRRCLNTSRAKELFGFQARWTLREGLRKTVEWFLRSRQTGRDRILEGCGATQRDLFKN